MTFDEQLKGAFDTITDLMREEIRRQVRMVVDELSESARVDREQAVADASEAAERDARQREATVVALAETHGREQGQEEGRRQAEEAGRAAIEAAERDASQREATVVALAETRGREQGQDEGRRQAEEAGRAAIEAAERDASQREATAVALAETRGREQGEDEGRRQAEEAGRAAIEAALAARPVEIPAPDGASTERLVEAVRSISRARSLNEILDTLLSSVGREAGRAGVLLVRGGHAQGWRFAGFDPAIDSPQSITVSLDADGVIADAVRTNTPVNNVSGKGGEIEAPVFAALPSGRECLAVPIALGDEVVAVLYADQGSAHAEPMPAWMDAVEVVVRHAARSLEALTAFKAARAVMAGADSSKATRSGAGEGAGAEEDVSARRYARLLVSEIKLYHEAVVAAGRRDRDLGTRLGGEIARARVLYEQRVPPHVRQHADYFQDELVRTLADGDAGLLEVNG